MHSFGGIFVLDCIASGTVWVDMAENGVDALANLAADPAARAIAVQSSRHCISSSELASAAAAGAHARPIPARR